MFHQNINLPLIIESVCLKDLSLSRVFNSYNLSFNKVLILTGGPNSSKFADQIADINQGLISHIHKETDNSLELVSSLKSKVFDLKIDVILGIGGGTVLDTAKFLATKTKIPYFAIPTVVSSDALASPISILKNKERTKGYSSQIPSGILIDYEVISQSGRGHIQSGLGDILSNLSALNDWDLAVKAEKAKPNNFARFLSEVAVTNIINQDIKISEPEFIKTYINSIIISGLAMNISGNSRPCSGSEHLLAHALEKFAVDDKPHGLLVGALTPFCLYLQKQLQEKVFEKFKELKLTELTSALLSSIDLQALLETAKSIRGNRYTVLNEYSPTEIQRKYSEFCKLI